MTKNKSKKSCLRYSTWYGEGDGSPKHVKADVARATAGVRLFKKLRNEAMIKGHAMGGRHGYYTVIVENVCK